MEISNWGLQSEAMSHMSDLNWFAATVKWHHEKAVAEHLRAQSLQEYLPIVKTSHSWSDRTKTLDLPLFPSYVFCRVSIEDCFRVLRTPSVYSLVGYGGVPACIPNSEIEAVERMLRSGCPVGPWPLMQAGQRVRIERGALSGMEGFLVREKSVVRVVISIELLQRSVAVEIDREMLAVPVS
jgi:transcription antitermination factor NusG